MKQALIFLFSVLAFALNAQVISLNTSTGARGFNVDEIRLVRTAADGSAIVQYGNPLINYFCTEKPDTIVRRSCNKLFAVSAVETVNGNNTTVPLVVNRVLIGSITPNLAGKAVIAYKTPPAINIVTNQTYAAVAALADDCPGSGGGGGTGTVTSFGFNNANGITGTVATPTSTPMLTISLGAITPTSVNGATISTSGASLMLSGGGKTLDVPGNATVSGTNTGDVSLAGENYLSRSSQVITANPIDLSGSNVTGTLKVASTTALTGDVTKAAGSLATTIAVGAVSSTKLAAGSVSDSTKVGANAIQATNIATGQVWARNLAAGAVSDSSKLAASAITATRIASNAVTGIKIAVNSIDSTKIKPLSINNSDLAGGITLSKLGQSGAAPNQVPQWNGSAWVPASAAGGVGNSGWIIKAATPTGADTLRTWVNLSENDGTGIYNTYQYVYGVWKKIGYYDRIQGTFSAQQPVYIVITGQSNATPRCGPTSNPADTVPSKFQCIWNPTIESWARPFKTNWYWMNGLTTKTAWWGTTIGQQAEQDGRLTRVVYAALGGRAIANWISPTGTQWDTISARVFASGIPRIDVLVWYQGETDGWTGRTQRQYTQDWFTVMNQFRNLSKWQKSTRVLAVQIKTGLVSGETIWPGEIPDGQTANYLYNQLNTDGLDWTNCVYNSDAVVVSDSSHIDAQSQVNLGRRIWASITGRSNIIPNYDYSRFVATGYDTIAMNFNYTSFVIKKATTNTTVLQKLLGWQTGKNVSFRIESPTISSKTVALNSQMYCQNLLGDVVELDTIWGSYSSAGSLRNDTLLLFQCPANYKAALEYPLSLSPYVWLDAGKETKFTNGQQVDTLHDWSGNNRNFTAPLVNRGPTWKKVALNFRPSFKFSTTLADTTTAKWAVRNSSDMSVLQKDSATVFVIVKMADSILVNGTLSGIIGGTVGSAQRGYGMYYQRNPGNGVVANLISNGSNLVVSNSNSLNGYTESNFGMLAFTTDPENATAALRARAYVGPLGPYAANTQSNTLSTTNTSNFFIGRTNTGNFSFVGEICEVVIYNRILTASQISAMKSYFALKYNLAL